MQVPCSRGASPRVSRRPSSVRYADTRAAVSVRFRRPVGRSTFTRSPTEMLKDGMASTVQDNRWRSDSGEARISAKEKAAAELRERSVRIVQQFRERHNMTYEIDCSGTPLVLRVFFPPEGAPNGQWRIEASAGQSQPISGSASSRAQALQNVAQSFRDANTTAVANLDWNGVAQAMTSVRAI